MKRKLKKEVIYSLYAVGGTLCLLMVALISTATPVSVNEDTTFVNSSLFDVIIPVSNTDVIINRPYLDENVSILISYYDYQGENENQISSLIEYDGTYMQNSGVTYGGVESFDVVSILDGTVTKVSENDLLGQIVEITHDYDLVSVYMSLGEVIVSENDVITQGSKIGVSGTSTINSTLGNTLQFELIKNGELLNPENYYDTLFEQLKEQ
ncbi:MAG: M23 family metallopeptidase [Mycoplasmatota bacterium]